MDTELRRFESYFFMPKSPGDATQVPVTGAVLYPTRQGASVTTSVTFNEQEELDVTVVDAGLIRAGDVLFMDLDTDVQLSVVAVSADRTTRRRPVLPWGWMVCGAASKNPPGKTRRSTNPCCIAGASW